MKLSFIVPVYNVEDYLNDCLQSLYNQSLSISDFEIVIINDGSTDGSVEIIQQYVERYDNIRFFDQPNQGLSATRNRGMQYAVGEYLLFIDSDDFLLPNTVSILLSKAIENELDILRGEYQHCTERGQMLPKGKGSNKKSLFADKIVDGNVLYQSIFCEEFYSPLLLMKRRFLIENTLFFVQGMYFEDIDFALRISLIAKRVMYFPLTFYVYRIRQNSITHTINEKKIKDLISIVLTLRGSSRQTSICAETQYVIEENVTRLFVYLLLRLAELPAEKYTPLIQLLEINRIRPLSVSGGLKECIISLLYNSCSIHSIPLLAPVVWLKNKMEK